MNIHKIISFDSNKVWFEILNGTKICKKRTNSNEVHALIKTHQFLKDKKLKISEKEYVLSTPNILNWDNMTGILTMSFCEGNNLESILCDETIRKYGVEVLREMLRFILKNKFFWKDFAPRNIIINGNNIYIMDFEHGIATPNTTLEEFLRFRVLREYSSFLLPHERAITVDKIFNLKDGEENEIIEIDSCSKRIIAIAKMMGYSSTMTTQESLEIQKKIINAEQPYWEKGRIVFPRIMIESLFEEKKDEVYDKYAEFVLSNNRALKKSNIEKELQ